MTRLRSDFWVSAYLRQRQMQGRPAVLVRRGADQAGAIFVRIDRLDGQIVLYGPADQGSDTDGVRRFRKIATGDALTIQDRMTREIKFDGDLWLVDVEDREGSPALDLAQDPD